MRRTVSGDQANEAQTEAEHLEAELIEFARETTGAIEEFVIQQPHAALALALGAGFIMGGGLTPRRLLRWGLLAAAPVLTRGLGERIVAAMDEAFAGQNGGGAGSTAPSPPTGGPPV